MSIFEDYIFKGSRQPAARVLYQIYKAPYKYMKRLNYKALSIQMYKTNGELAQKGKSNRGDSGLSIVDLFYRADEYKYGVVGLRWKGEKQGEDGVWVEGKVLLLYKDN